MHLTAAVGAAALGVVTLVRSGRSPLLTSVFATAATIAAWNTSQGLNVQTGTWFWQVLSPSLAPLPLAAFTTLVLRASAWTSPHRRRLEIGAAVLAGGLSLFTLAAFVSAGINVVVLSPRWNYLFAAVALPFVVFNGWLLLVGYWRGARQRRPLRLILMVAGSCGFVGGLSEVLPPDRPLQIGALALLVALAIAAVGVVARGLGTENIALQEILVTLAAVAAIVATAGLVVWRGRDEPVLAAAALSGAGLAALAAYRLVARRWQFRIEQAARLAALGRATGVLAHEVRNPLTTVQGAIDIVAEELRRDGAAVSSENYLDTARGEIRRVLELVEDCLTYARAPAPSVERFDLRALVERVIGAARLRFGQARLDYLAPTDEIAIVGDSSQLYRLVENLVVNACQVQDRPQVQIAIGRETDQQVFVSVSDDGPGVPDHLRTQIFEPFFTTKAKGGGLGLAIAREIAQRHGGDIAIERANLGGACFVARWQQTQTP